MTTSVPVFLPLEVVLARFALSTGTPVAELSGPAVTRDITRLRHECMWLLRNLTTANLEQIGATFGRSGATANEGIDRIARRLEVDADYRAHMIGLQAVVSGVSIEPRVPCSLAVTVEEHPDLHRLMAVRVLSDTRLSDDDAKQAALTILTSGMAPVPETPKGF